MENKLILTDWMVESELKKGKQLSINSNVMASFKSSGDFSKYVYKGKLLVDFDRFIAEKISEVLKEIKIEEQEI